MATSSVYDHECEWLRHKIETKKKNPLGYLSMDFGCKIDKLFQ